MRLGRARLSGIARSIENKPRRGRLGSGIDGIGSFGNGRSRFRSMSMSTLNSGSFGGNAGIGIDGIGSLRLGSAN